MRIIDCTTDELTLSIPECSEPITEAWLTRCNFEPIQLVISEVDGILTLTAPTEGLAQGIWKLQLNSICACYSMPVYINLCQAPEEIGEHTPTNEDEGEIVQVCCSDYIVSVIVDSTTPAGEEACFTVRANREVEDDPLTVEGIFSGTEQPLPPDPGPVTIPVGQREVEICVPTEADGMASTTLCLDLEYTGSLEVTTNDGCTQVERADVEFVATVSCPGSLNQGNQVCYQVSLNTTVSSPTTLFGQYSGSEQDLHGYPQPQITIPTGASQGQTCVTTQESQSDTQLCLTFPPGMNPSISASNTCCTDLIAPTPEVDYEVTVSGPSAVVEGENACYTLTLDQVVQGTPLQINTVLSGSNQIANNYPEPTAVIPVGVAQGQVCVQTNDNNMSDIEELCLEVQLQARITQGDQHCMSIVGSDVGPGDETYEVQLNSTPTWAIAGTDACYTLTLDRPLESAFLDVQTELSGDAQTDMNLTPPTFSFSQGDQQAVACVTTLPRAAPYREGLSLTVPALQNPRITNAPITRVVTVYDEMETDTQVDSSTIPGLDVPPGVTYTIQGRMRIRPFGLNDEDAIGRVFTESDTVVTPRFRFLSATSDPGSAIIIDSVTDFEVLARLPLGSGAPNDIFTFTMEVRAEPEGEQTLERFLAEGVVNSTCTYDLPDGDFRCNRSVVVDP